MTEEEIRAAELRWEIERAHRAALADNFLWELRHTAEWLLLPVVDWLSRQSVVVWLARRLP